MIIFYLYGLFILKIYVRIVQKLHNNMKKCYKGEKSSFKV